MSKPMGTAGIVYAALVIAILGISITGYLFYKTSSEITATNEKLDDLSRKLDAVSKTQDYQILISRIEELNRTISNAASIQDLVGIKEQIDSLRASINATNSALLGQLDQLEERVKRLEERTLFPATVVDGTGDQVVILSRPARIVSLAPSVTEILYYVNATDRLVGVDSYSDYPQWIPEARRNGTLIDVGGFYSPSIEAILSAKPDLVIGVAGVPPHVQVKQVLKAYGIPVILLPQKGLNDVKESLLIVGRATGNVDQAVKAAVDYESELARIRFANYNETPSVTLILWLNPTWVAGNNTFQSEALYWAGGVNSFANYTGWGTVSPEQLLSIAPQVIIGVNVNHSSIISYLKQSLGDSANQIPAIADGRVYCIGSPYSDMLSRPSPRIVEAIIALQILIHPELYGYTLDTVPHCIDSATMPVPPPPPTVKP